MTAKNSKNNKNNKTSTGYVNVASTAATAATALSILRANQFGSLRQQQCLAEHLSFSGIDLNALASALEVISKREDPRREVSTGDSNV